MNASSRLAHPRLVVHKRRSGEITTRRQNPERVPTMSSITHPIAVSAPFARSVAIAALLGATMLASPLTAARADTATNAAIQLAQAAAPQNPAAAGATQTKGVTVEQRIKDLYAALKITPAQDSKWNEVAQDMRENAAAMDKLIAANRTTPPQTMTAVEDLKMYQKFAQAHVDGLKNLISSFDKLYAAMPDAQKKIADAVFSSPRT
jgi:periplasmic protein CpxP/Spy